MKTLSESLRAAIEKSGLSVYRLSKESGVQATMIHMFLRGEKDLRLSTADRLAAALGLKLS